MDGRLLTGGSGRRLQHPLAAALSPRTASASFGARHTQLAWDYGFCRANIDFFANPATCSI